MRFIIRAGMMVMILLMCSNALAFDGRRKGFALGLNAGVHSTDRTQSYNGDTLSSRTDTGPAWDLRIGGGLDEQWLACFHLAMNSYERTNADGADSWVHSGIIGFGMTCHLTDRARFRTSDLNGSRLPTEPALPLSARGFLIRS